MDRRRFLESAVAAAITSSSGSLLAQSPPKPPVLFGSTSLSLGPLPEETAFIARMTGPSAYAFNADPGGAVLSQTRRTSAYVALRAGFPQNFQYDSVLGLWMNRDLERYWFGSKDGDGNLSIPDTSNDADWDQMLGKHQDYMVGFHRPNGWGTNEAYCAAQGLLNSHRKSYSSPVSGLVTLTDFGNMTSANPGDPVFEERKEDNFTDTDGDAQTGFYIDIHRQRRQHYLFERTLGKVWANDTTTDSLTRFNWLNGYANPSGWVAGQAPQFPNQQNTRNRIEWPVEAHEYLFDIVQSITDGGPATNPWMLHDTTRKHPPFIGYKNGHRFAPWMFGIGTQNMCLWMEYLEKESLPVTTFWDGRSGYSNPFDQLADFLEWQANTAVVHPSNADSPGQLMYVQDGTYKTFRFQDRNISGVGSPNATAISTQAGAAYGWVGKQLALGNVALGVTQNIARAEAMFAIGDQVFAHAQSKDPFLTYNAGIVRLKEEWEIYNPCQKYWFWRKEAQGIDTGRTWV